MKIGWSSNARHAQTGYGIETNLMVPRIKALGHEVWVSAFYGLQGSPQLDGDGIMTLPASKDPYGNDMLAADAERWAWDIAITLIDAWVINPQNASQTRWVPWFPVDCDPVPPAVANVLRAAYKPIAYSQFGQKALEKAGMKVEYVPHGVDTAIYKPKPRAEALKALQAPDDIFLVGIVAANKGYPSRKCFDQQIRAFAKFWRNHPNSMLYIHSDMFGGYGGEDIKAIAQLAGLPPQAVAEPPPYEFLRGMLGDEYMVNVYNACNVLLNATRGEGFGIPIIEAMACGTPAIVTDCTAMPELIDAGAGWKVPVGEDNKFFYQNSYQFVPHVSDIAVALEKAYEARDDQAFMDKARAGMVANYDADYVVQTYWKPVLDKIEGEIADLKAKQAERAAKRANLRLVQPEPAPVTTNGDKPAETVITGGAV